MRRLSEADIRTIYDACMEGGTGFKITATDTSAALDAPFSLFCRHHGDRAKMDPPDPLLRALSARGIEHESNVAKSDYPETERAAYETPQEGLMAALRSMADGAPALLNMPLFWLPEGMYGRPDVLERRDGESVFGSHHYVVREIKVAGSIKETHTVQAAFYALMLGRIQRRTPEYFLVTNGDGATTRYRYGQCEDLLLECMETAARIRGGWMPPVVYGDTPPPWSNYGNEVAIRNDDVSLIPGIGAGKRAGMVEAGFATVNDILSSTAAELQRVRGVGEKTAADCLASARAIRGREPVRKGGAIDLPVRSTEIFLDLEGLIPPADSIGDYLIGALVRRDGAETYRPFIAEWKREDVMLVDFLDFMGEQEDCAVYHWGSYDRTRLRSMTERHCMEGYMDPGAMIDLLPIATGAFAFPTYRNTLKDIAKWMGFSWRRGDVGAASSRELYLAYAEDPEAGREGMQLVLDYNEDDCTAARVVKDWLVDMS